MARRPSLACGPAWQGAYATSVQTLVTMYAELEVLQEMVFAAWHDSHLTFIH